MRMAIMGTGSLGTILGAYISKAGHKIDLIDPYKEHVEVLNKNGAKVIGLADFTQAVTAITPSQMEGIYDLVFYMTKQTYNEEAFKNLKPHVNDKSIIVTLQNGLPERAVVREFGEDRVMGCPVGWGATFKGPGLSELTSDINKAWFDLGRVDGKITPALDEVKKILDSMCNTIITDNLMGIRFSKLLANATFSGMSASMACPFVDVLENEKALTCVKYIGNECIKIAGAAKIKMEPFGECYPQRDLVFTTIEEREALSQVYKDTWWPHRMNRASMLQDLEKGRKCEINAINGVVCEMGDEYGIDTPLNDQVVDVVSRIEQGKLKVGNHLDLFRIPDKI